MTVPSITHLVQQAAAPGLWSRGVKLARAGAVTLESRNEEEAVLRVRAPGRPVALSVQLVLVPGDEEWDCDCGGRVMPCEHIAAAAIVLGQLGPKAAGRTKEQSESTGSEATQGRIVYRFARAQAGLSVERFIVTTDGEVLLEESLSARLSRPAAAAHLRPEQPDLCVDLLLERRGRAVLPAEKLHAVLLALSELSDTDARTRIFLDGQAVAIAHERLAPLVHVCDDGDDTVLRIDRDPRVDEVVATGVARSGSTLYLLSDLDLTGGWLQDLPREQRFTRAQLGTLVTRVLPELARRLLVRQESTRLPAIVRGERPRVTFDIVRDHDGLSVLPLIVYGDPPRARIDDGRLVHLGGAVPVRDLAAEQQLRLRLHEDLNLLPGRRSRLAGADATRLAERLQRWAARGTDIPAVRSLGELKPVLAVSSLAKSVPGGASGGGWTAAVEFRLEHEGRVYTVSAETVLQAFADGQSLVPLGDGFAALPRGFLDRHADKIEALLISRTGGGAVANHAWPILGELCEALDVPKPPDLERLRPIFESFDQIPRAPLPADLNAELRGYQRAGVDWLCFLRTAGLGAILADDMGLGKTLQALCAMRGRTLVICPTSVLPGWRQQAERFRPHLRVCEYPGARRALDPEADLTITSYAHLRLHAQVLGSVRWDTLILDEAQAIKNPDSQTARAAFQFAADFRIALSGTPVENRLDELWSLCHFANPGLLGSRAAFANRFAEPIAAGDVHAARKLKQRITPFILRRLKKDVAPELPPRSESTLYVALDENERAVYDAVRAAARVEVVRLLDGGASIMTALEALLRLRQAACHTGLVPGQTASRSSKVDALIDALETAVAEGHKALVFSQWTTLLDRIEPALNAAGLSFARLDGSTRDRASVVARFSDPAGPPVLLVSLKAGGAGLNLAAADHVFICDPWWNPAIEAQAADRAHRIGQDRPVFVYRLVARDTIEEKMLLLKEHKRRLAAAVVEVQDSGPSRLTRADLLELLESGS